MGCFMEKVEEDEKQLLGWDYFPHKGKHNNGRKGDTVGDQVIIFWAS